MKTDAKIPFAIADYIQTRFREEFLFEIKDIREHNGRMVYTVEVSKDDYIHTLTFDENGKLLNEKADPAFPPDDEQTYGDVPE